MDLLAINEFNWSNNRSLDSLDSKVWRLLFGTIERFRVLILNLFGSRCIINRRLIDVGKEQFYQSLLEHFHQSRIRFHS